MNISCRKGVGRTRTDTRILRGKLYREAYIDSFTRQRRTRRRVDRAPRLDVLRKWRDRRHENLGGAQGTLGMVTVLSPVNWILVPGAAANGTLLFYSYCDGWVDSLDVVRIHRLIY